MSLESFKQKFAWLKFKTIDPFLLLLLLVDGFLLLYRLAEPDGSLIFDESYYVNDTRVILGRAVLKDHLPETFFAGCDPNSEHPPLAKLIMAAGMIFFSENSIGWRLPSVMLGVLSIWMVYIIVRSVGGNSSQARWAATLLALDNLFFVHSRIATLDIYLISFMLVGTALYLRGRYEFAGIAFGLSTLCKINGLLGVAAIFLYELGCRFLTRAEPAPQGSPAEEPAKKHSWLPFAIMVGFYLTFSFVGLGTLDCYWTEFSGPTRHVMHVFKFGTSLVREAGIGPQGAESTPLQWWLNEKSIEYLSVNTISNGNSTPTCVFLGKMNPYLIAAAPFALFFCALAARRGNRLGILVVCMIVGNYCPMLLTWLKTRRICYIYYMVPSLPWLAIGVGASVQELPRWVRWVLLLASLYAFRSTFPFKS